MMHAFFHKKKKNQVVGYRPSYLQESEVWILHYILFCGQDISRGPVNLQNDIQPVMSHLYASLYSSLVGTARSNTCDLDERTCIGEYRVADGNYSTKSQ